MAEDEFLGMQFDRIRFDSVESSFQYDFHSDIYFDICHRPLRK